MTTIAPEQLTLDLRPLTQPLYAPGMTLEERFEAFHAANPHVADALESLAAQWLSRHRKVGVKPGNAMRLANMPIGTIVHNVEMKKGRGGQIA